jgi:hypothetical protein
MPRGRPRKLTTIRLPPDLLDTVVAQGVGVTEAIEEGLHLWLARRRRQAKAPAPARPARQQERSTPP